MPAIETSPPIRVDIQRRHETSILIVSGVLDGSTYRGLRDAVIKAALDEPRAVIVDATLLSVPSRAAWSVFTSARWHVSTWPDVPILLACERSSSRRAIADAGVTRYVPVHATRELALAAVAEMSVHARRRARARLPAVPSSVRQARELIDAWLTVWAQSRLISVAGTVATVFIENVLAHTASEPVLIVESYQETVTIAVEDASRQPAARHEDEARGADMVSGLSIVAALCRAWGSTPTSSGKTVWAVVGRENEF
ncbi:sulfate transporter [Mycobacterium sp. 1164966.3]|uniref:sulfate transporter n=1 Tax=Mycobacterium sp. 1164966.3 TaxID=1856861 RepID=UPI0007FDCD9C|nr:sulfate transporter [Mycobacterium sp. 1164966.3]OBA80183.1 sulfate transporter [Mycobacterium sp. 1164966.3]